MIFEPSLPVSECSAADASGGGATPAHTSSARRERRRRKTVSPGEPISKLLQAPQAPAPFPPRVLLAEDNRDLQQIFAHQLTLLGLEVIGVSNGRDAVDLALAALRVGNPFDLVLMDLEMPIVDGYEATRLLRDGGFAGPILALSAHSTDDNRMDCIELGCNDCLCKPIDWSRFAELVHRFLPRLPDRIK